IECLSGQRAFQGTVSEATAARLHSDPALPPGISAPWRSVLRSMTSRSPGDRPGAAEVAETLGRLSRGGPDTRLSAVPTTREMPIVAPEGAAAPTLAVTPASNAPAPTAVAPLEDRLSAPPGRSRSTALLALLVCLILGAGVLTGVLLGDSGAKGSGSPAVTTLPPTTVTTTTLPATTTTARTVAGPPSPSAAVGATVAAVDAAVQSGAIPQDTGSHLLNDLAAIPVTSQGPGDGGPAPQFNTFVQDFGQAVSSGNITSQATITSIWKTVTQLAKSLGVAPPPQPTLPPAGDGHKHHHGPGGGQGNG
ncbi:MAG TPA: hypothetical protein VGS21_02895, partial [Acidimicrobiales bacterium]|nr:hypothetical protein [Acidimicrobiales bacterium]